MAKSFEIAFKIGASIAGGFAQTMKGAEGALNSLNSQVKSLGNQQTANKNLIELKKTVALSSIEYTQARQKVAELGKALSKTAQPTKAMRDEFKRAEEAVSKAKKRLSDQRDELNKLNSTMGATGKSTAQLVAEQNKLQLSGEKAKKAQESLQRTMAAQQQNIAKRSNYRGQMLDTAALAVTAGAPVKMAIDWEQKLAEFNKVANLGEAELNKYANAAQNLAIETGVASEEIMGAYIAAAQAGFDKKEWEEYAIVAAKMGVAFDTTGEAAGEMIKNWRSGMGLSMKEAEMMAAAANHLANNMNATASGIGEVLQRQGAVLKAAGLNDTEAAALSGALLSSGAAPEQAATAAKNFGNALTKSFSATKAQTEIWKGMGFDTKKLAVDMQNDAERTIKRVLTAISKQDSDKQNAIIGVLFGEESKGAIMPLIQNMENLDRAFSLVKDQSQYVSSLEDEFNAMGNTTQQQMKKAKESLKTIGVTIGSTVLPALNKLLKKASEIGMIVANWAKENKKLVTIVVTVTTSLVALKVATLASAYAFTFVKGAVLATSSAFQTAKLLITTLTTTIRAMAGAQGILNAVMMANPIGLVVVAIAGLVAIGVVLYKYWDYIAAFFTGVWQGFKDGINSLVDRFTFLQPVIEHTKMIFGFLGEMMSELISWFTGTSSSVEGLEKSASIGQMFGQTLAAAFEIILIPLKLLIDGIGWVINAVPNVYNAVSETFGAVGDFFSGLNLFESGTKIITTIKDGIVSKAGEIVDSVKGVFSTIREYLPFSDAKVGPLSNLTASGAAIMTTLKEGIMSKASAVIDSVKGVFSKVREYLPFSDAKVGPLSSLTASGQAIMSTLGDGMEKYDVSKMSASFSGIADQINSDINPQLSYQNSFGFSDELASGMRAQNQSSYDINITQNITVGSGDKNVYAQAKAGAEDGAKSFIKLFEKAMKDERRLSFG